MVKPCIARMTMSSRYEYTAGVYSEYPTNQRRSQSVEKEAPDARTRVSVIDYDTPETATSAVLAPCTRISLIKYDTQKKDTYNCCASVRS